MEKSKLYFSIGTLSSGGAERVLSILSNRLVYQDYEVTIFTWKHSDIFYDVDKRITIIDIEKETKSSDVIKKARFFRSYVKNNKPDLILSFLAKINILVLFCCLGYILESLFVNEMIQGKYHLIRY